MRFYAPSMHFLTHFLTHPYYTHSQNLHQTETSLLNAAFQNKLPK